MLSEQENGSDPGAEIYSPVGRLGSPVFNSWDPGVSDKSTPRRGVGSCPTGVSLLPETHLDPGLLPKPVLEREPVAAHPVPSWDCRGG